MIHIVHFIPDIEASGGAERVLRDYVKNSQHTFTHHIISFSEKRACHQLNNNVYLYYFNIKNFYQIICIIRLLRKIKPKVLQGWMYHGNILAFLCKFFLKSVKLFWNIRREYNKSNKTKKLTNLLNHLCAYLSRFVHCTIFVSHRAQVTHAHIGYSTHNFRIIANGFDQKKFRPNDILRQSCRKELGINNQEFIIGYVGRFHPIKGIHDFIKSVLTIMNIYTNVKVIMIGAGFEIGNMSFMDLIKNNPMAKNFLILGIQDQVQNYYHSFDLLISTSYCEGFSNTIAEASFCGVPVLASRVGNAEEMIDPRFLFRAGNVNEIVEKICIFYKNKNMFKKYFLNNQSARYRDLFSLEKMVQEYDEIYAIDTNTTCNVS